MDLLIQPTSAGSHLSLGNRRTKKTPSGNRRTRKTPSAGSHLSLGNRLKMSTNKRASMDPAVSGTNKKAKNAKKEENEVKITCKCGETCKPQKTKYGKNKGRFYYTCPKSEGFGDDVCGYFMFAGNVLTFFLFKNFVLIISSYVYFYCNRRNGRCQHHYGHCQCSTCCSHQRNFRVLLSHSPIQKRYPTLLKES